MGGEGHKLDMGEPQEGVCVGVGGSKLDLNNCICKATTCRNKPGITEPLVYGSPAAVTSFVKLCYIA